MFLIQMIVVNPILLYFYYKAFKTYILQVIEYYIYLIDFYLCYYQIIRLFL